MRVRDALFLLCGLAAGAGIAVLAGKPGRGISPPGPAPVQAEEPAPRPEPPRVAEAPAADPPVPGDGEGPAGARGLRLRALDLELQTQRLLLGRRGEAEPATKPGYPGNPRMKADPADLAADRERAAREVEPLLDAWRSASPGAERAAAMEALAVPLYRLLEAGGSTDHLVTLEEAAERGETETERRWAVIATHRLWQAPVVDFLLARARSPHAEVRFYAVEGLAWVRGGEMGRAVDGVVGGLEDTEPRVRGIAALSLGAILADPARAEGILAALGRESDPAAAADMARAVLLLDPQRGRERVAKSLEAVSGDVRAAAEKAIAPAR